MSRSHRARLTLSVLRALAALVALPSAVGAQETGRITGRVVDARSGQGLTDVGLQVVGTTTGASSGVDGRFTIVGVRPGTVGVTARRLGFAPKTVTALTVTAGAAQELTITLEPVTLQLQAQVVTATKERGSVSEALDQQRTATQIVNSVTSEQIARSPDSDAGQAVQRVSGVTVQDGKYVFVRGLGERYTTASLNGARIPSPEPERKVVPLDLFPSGLLQSITTSKSFTPDLQGDFSGAHVDIRTREFPATRQVTYSFSTGINQLASGRTLLVAPRAGGEYLGMTGSRRDMPGALASSSIGQLSARSGEIIRSLRNVWSPAGGDGLPNSSFGLSVGGNDPIAGHNVGYLLSGSYSLTQETRSDEESASPILVAGEVRPRSHFRGGTSRVSAQWGGLANVSTLIGTTSRLSWNNTLVRSADNEARQDRGFDEDRARELERTTLRYVERSVWSSQLALEGQPRARFKYEVSVTGSGTNRREPDRSDVVRGLDTLAASPLTTAMVLQTSDIEGARRLFFDLRERNVVGTLNNTLFLGDVSRGNALKFGVYARRTERAADAPQYALVSLGAGLPRETLAQPTEIVFAPANAGHFRIDPIGQSGSYSADDRLLAGYAMADVGLGARVRMISGLRFERSEIGVDAETQLGTRTPASLETNDLLPSLVVNTRLGENSALRVSASQTLARPEYRELANITFRDVLGGVSLSGNAALRRTTIRNVDARWEWFPAASEIVSLGVFHKDFVDPIERIELAQSGGTLQRFVNAEGARNQGVEAEVRLGAERVAERLAGLTAFTNVTVMQSRIELDPALASAATNTTRAMVGQAPWVFNGGMTYATESGATSATLLYNVVGRRIAAAGTKPLPDVYEMPRHVLDLSVRVPLARTIALRADARNLLDAPYRLQQGALVREGYRAGRVFGVGMTWRP